MIIVFQLNESIHRSCAIRLVWSVFCVCTRVQLPVKVKPELRTDGVVVDPSNFLQQHLSSLQQQQQHPKPSSSSSSSATNNTPFTDVSHVTWQQQQLRAIQHQLLLMQGLPTMMSTTISQPGSSIYLFLSMLVCSIFTIYYRRESRGVLWSKNFATNSGERGAIESQDEMRGEWGGDFPSDMLGSGSLPGGPGRAGRAKTVLCNLISAYSFCWL